MKIFLVEPLTRAGAEGIRDSWVFYQRYFKGHSLGLVRLQRVPHMPT